jgi:hypothetical protein
MRHVVPGRVYGQRRIQQHLVHKIRHFADRPPKPSGRKPVWPTHLEVITRKLFGNIIMKNLGPGFVPESLREPVIIGAQFFFNVSRQRSS